MTSRARSSGWWLTIGAAVIAAAAVALSILLYGSGEEGIRVAVRSTARWSAIVFSLTFATSALHTLVRSERTRWLLASRRQLGLGFAAAHFIHLGTFVTLAFAHAESFWAHVSRSTLIGGGFGYVLIAAMAATSFDAAQKKLGRAWRALHAFGMWVLFGIFVFSYLGRAATMPLYTALFAVLVIALVTRIAGRIARRAGRKEMQKN